MSQMKDLIRLSPSRDDVINSLEIAKEQTIQQIENNAFKDNLRFRTPSVSFDSKFRGALGERMMLKFFNEYNIKAQKIDIQNASDGNGDFDMNVKGHDNNEYSIEVKTSLLAGHNTSLQAQVDNYNLIVQKKHKFIEDDVTRDLHIQIIFNFSRSYRDEFVNQNEPNFKHKIYYLNTGDLSSCFRPQVLANNMYFTAWATSNEIINYVNSLPLDDCTWGYSYNNYCKDGRVERSQRDFWKYPISISNAPETLPQFIKGIDERQHNEQQELIGQQALFGQQQYLQERKQVAYKQKSKEISL